jgi:sugar phosphate permease
MSLRRLSKRVFEPLSMIVMVLGIVALCQPWSQRLHSWSVAIMLLGLIGFMVFSKVPPAADEG